MSCEILGDLGIGEAEGAERILEVWNKIDRLEPEAHDAIVQKASTAQNVIAVSAKSGEGVDRLMNEISRRLSGVLTEATITLPVDKLALLPWLYNHAIVDGREDNEDGTVTLDVRLTETEAVELERRMGNGPKPQRERLGIGVLSSKLTLDRLCCLPDIFHPLQGSAV